MYKNRYNSFYVQRRLFTHVKRVESTIKILFFRPGLRKTIYIKELVQYIRNMMLFLFTLKF